MILSIKVTVSQTDVTQGTNSCLLWMLAPKTKEDPNSHSGLTVLPYKTPVTLQIRATCKPALDREGGEPSLSGVPTLIIL